MGNSTPNYTKSEKVARFLFELRKFVSNGNFWRTMNSDKMYF